MNRIERQLPGKLCDVRGAEGIILALVEQIK